jgi:hypothetical protein
LKSQSARRFRARKRTVHQIWGRRLTAAIQGHAPRSREVMALDALLLN